MNLLTKVCTTYFSYPRVGGYSSMFRILLMSIQRGYLSTRVIFFFLWRCGPTWAMASSFMRFLDHTQRRITVGRTPLDE